MSVVNTRPGWRRAGSALRITKEQMWTVPDAIFWIYMYFLLDYFLRFASRVSVYAQFRPTLLLFGLLTILLFTQKDKLKGRMNDPIFKTILVLLIYMIISLPLVEYAGSVIRHNLPDFIRAIIFLFFTGLIVDTDKRLKIFLFVFVFCQVFRVLEPLYLNITQGYWGSATHIGGGEFAQRLAGAPADVINSNELGFVIVTAIPFLHYLLFTGGWFKKLIYLLLMPLLFYALILTMSRGAFIALLVVAWMVFKESRHKIVLIVFGIGIAISGWSIMTPIQQDRYMSLFSSDTIGASSAQGRYGGMLWELGLGMERPIFGHGLGTTSEAKWNKRGSTQAAHNFYAELIIEIGVVGLVLFLRYIFSIVQRFRTNRKLLLKARNVIGREFYGNLNKALVAVVWMYVVYSINYWGLSQYYWYLLGGMAIAYGHVVSKAIEDNAKAEHVSRPDRNIRNKMNKV